MRNKFLIFCFSLCLTTLMAQSVPQAFKYQSVIRDANGNTMVNKPVKIQFKLSQYTGANLVAVYTETQAATTTKIGLINLNVGKGTVVLGNFSQTDWSKPTFLNIGVDIAGGNNFTDLGAAELLSVPYALYSANGDIKQTLSQSGSNVTLSNAGGTISINDADASPTNEIQTITKSGSDVTLSLNGGTVSINDADASPTNEIQTITKSGSDVSLSLNGGTVSINDADASPTNEIQTITKSGSDVTLSLNGGTVSINDADASPTNEIEMPTDAVAGDISFYNGTSWKRVPKGKGGQTLTLRNNGNPEWAGISTEGLFEVKLPNGKIMYVHPTDNATNIKWGPYVDILALPNTVLANMPLDFDGAGNTSKIVAQLGNNGGTIYAAKLCDDLVAFGFDDWYLPSGGEVIRIFSTTPGVLTGDYWASTELDAISASYVNNGVSSGSFNKDLLANLKCRCVRK